MKKAVLILLFSAGFVMAQTGQELSLFDVNFIPMDSLIIAEGFGTSGRASLTNSRYLGDTVTVTGVLVTDPRVIRNVGGHFSFYIQSTDSAEWGGMNVYTNDTSSNVINAGFGSIDSGSIIRVTGKLTKYGTDIMGNFELIPFASQTVTQTPIDIIRISGPRPAPAEVKLSDLVTGDVSAGGTVHFYPGTKYKNSYVVLRHLTVKTRSQNSSSGQWFVSLADSEGNTVYMYDPSKYFSGRVAYGDTVVNGPKRYVPPPVGSTIDYIRGILIAASATYGGYEIVPLYPGDIKIGAFTPSITATGFSTRRSAAFPGPSDQVKVRITAVSINPDTSVKVDSAAVYYSVNKGPYQRIKMTPDTSHTFYANIPPQADGSFVKYFFNAWQDTSSLKSTTPDTSKTAYFYYVRANGYKIKDLQYTPFSDGISGVIDLPVTVKGIIQADTSDFPKEIDRRNQAAKPESPMTFLQDAAGPWSGIMLYDTLTYKLHKGDSVSITGRVSEYSGMTEIVIDSAKVLQSGRQTYPPVVVTTGTVGGKASGDSTAERWESVLIQFNDVSIVNTDPDPSYSITSANGSFREYTVSDGSGECRVDDDGSNTYSVDPHDTLYGFTVLPAGTRISSLIGVLRYGNSNFKLEPRSNSDFVKVLGVRRDPDPVPEKFSLNQNYPNPFNPTTVISYSIPKAGIVTLKVYNILGQEVATLVNQRQSAGTYSVNFEASKFASGVYFCRLISGSYTSVRKMMLLK